MYFSNLSQAHVIGKLAEDIASLCQGDENDITRRSTIITDLTSCLLAISYQEETDASSKGLKKIAIALTDSIAKHLMKAQEGDINVFKCLHELDLSPEAAKRFCTRQLALILSRDPQIKVVQALASQAEWTYAKAACICERHIHTGE